MKNEHKLSNGYVQQHYKQELGWMSGALMDSADRY